MHLLLVEDDLELGFELQRALSGHGFTSEWVRSVQSAHALTDEKSAESPDLAFVCALLDLGLPDGQGLDLLSHWRRRGFTLPTIVLTARDAVESRISVLDAGADDYVVKPCVPAEIASRIHAVVRRSGGHASKVWTLANLQIDIGTREVRANGLLVSLSPKEYKILIELARQPDETVSKNRLVRAVSPLSETLEFSALEWHVHNLRRKLGNDSIRTVRGVGYHLASGQ